MKANGIEYICLIETTNYVPYNYNNHVCILHINCMYLITHHVFVYCHRNSENYQHHAKDQLWCHRF